MKAGYEVGEQITVLSRQNQWRQCIVQAKRPGQVILPTAPGVSNEGPRSEGLGCLAGCFLALGSGLGLVGTVLARR